MIVTEYNGHTQGFLVEGGGYHSCALIGARCVFHRDADGPDGGGPVTAVTELEDNRLVMMMDEKVLSETTNIDNEMMYRGVITVDRPEATCLYCDDSSVARADRAYLVAMGVKGDWRRSMVGRCGRRWKVATYAQSYRQNRFPADHQPDPSPISKCRKWTATSEQEK